MPIHDRGYRHWEGPLRSSLLRWWAITRTGIALGLRGKLLTRLLFVAWAPLLYFGPLFFAIGKVTDPDAESGRMWFEIAEEFFGPLAEMLRSHPDVVRPFVWSLVFGFYLGAVQLNLALIITAIVAPPQIARDIRSKAFLVYFSKPIGRAEYIVGKAGVVIGFLFWVTLLPALLLFLLSIVFSPSMSVLADTAGTVPRIAAAALVTTIPMMALGLFLSSLTPDDRFGMFGWIAIWIFGEIAYNATRQAGGALARQDWTVMLSIRQSIKVVVQDIFDAPARFEALRELGSGLRDLPGRGPHADIVGLEASTAGGFAFWWLVALTVACLVGLARRVAAPTRI